MLQVRERRPREGPKLAQDQLTNEGRSLGSQSTDPFLMLTEMQTSPASKNRDTGATENPRETVCGRRLRQEGRPALQSAGSR